MCIRDRTLALYHFNGDTYDSGINNLPLNWVSGASTDYLTVDSNFEGYLFLDNQNTHKFIIPVNYDGEDWSIEWRMYISGEKKFSNRAYSADTITHVPNSNQYGYFNTFYRGGILMVNDTTDVSFVSGNYSDVYKRQNGRWGASSHGRLSVKAKAISPAPAIVMIWR